ncbi:hypothetical protein N7509_007025 [Penicillium cosmopolitanum]|uniref:D-serine dehydratase-like domain-containing protein n=1 Tax=Penicillium cosmopolitanum TaxID=1131564 RepID=A0A9X0B7X8_9EURO|nr:uncharacterized protein N7509_007025 [Penicillium cosmopolitanum]KAJ5391535.1 hypothetical protein N7509_007025 [Penicillium cosmopolitanum]
MATTPTLPTQADLLQRWGGRDIADLPKPAAVIDRAITLEIAKLQLDKESQAPKFIASTLLEIETLTRFLAGLKQAGRSPNILYGIPLVPSHITRLAELAAEIGEESVTVMIDHPDQVQYLKEFSAKTNFPVCVFVKVDTGYHRAGLPPISLNKNGLLEKLAEAEEAGHAKLLGLYSHSSLSYGATNADEAMEYLIGEIQGCKVALNKWLHLLPKNRELVISVGATPQAISSYNLVQGDASAKAEELRALLRQPSAEQSEAQVKIELHAGNYPVLDMQQVSTHARNGAGGLEEEIAMSVVAEVCSVYNDGEREKPEALVAAGTLALGREPCAAYSGWGILSNWRQTGDAESGASRLMVERISQEHSIISWEMAAQESIPLQVGQIVKIYPNHSCVTGAFYGFYFVIDSSLDEASRVVDIWVRGRGGEVTDPLTLTRFQ